MAGFKYLLASLLLCPFTIEGEELRDCSLKNLTDNCQNFGPKSQLLNPWNLERQMNSESVFIQNGSGEEEDGGRDDGQNFLDQMNQIREIELATQAELLEKLQTGSPTYKLSLTHPGNLMALSLGFEYQKENAEAPSPSLEVVWPPDSKGSDIQLIEWKRFKSEYLDKLPAQELKNLKAAIATYRSRTTEVNPNESPYNYVEEDKEKPEDQIKRSQIEKMKADQVRRFRKLFEKAKEYVIEELQARPLNGTQSDRERLIAKVKSIQFSGIDDDGLGCKQDRDNAYYYDPTRAIVVCSGMTTQSDLSNIFVLGHEIGHAIDPCHAFNNHCTVLTSKSDLELSINKESSAERKLRAFLSHGVTKGQDAILTGFSEREFKELEEKGLIRSKNLHVAGVYPLDTTKRCIEDFYHFEKGQSKNQSSVNKFKRLNPDWNFQSSNSYCDEQGEMMEAMADVVGSKVSARYASDQNLRSKEDLLQVLFLNAAPACGGEAYEAHLIGDPHPFNRERVRMLTADPLIRDVFKCRENKRDFPQCFSKFGHLRSPTPTQDSKFPNGTKKGVK